MLCDAVQKPGSQVKRKGLGGLGPEKKKLLKKLIMQKANEVMKAEMQRRAKEKEEALKNILEPLKLDGLNKRTHSPLFTVHCSRVHLLCCT